MRLPREIEQVLAKQGNYVVPAIHLFLEFDNGQELELVTTNPLLARALADAPNCVSSLKIKRPPGAVIEIESYQYGYGIVTPKRTID